MKKPKHDYHIVALVSMIIRAWTDYEHYAKVLTELLEEKGFTSDEHMDAGSFISDEIIGNELKDAVKFESLVQKILKKK